MKRRADRMLRVLLPAVLCAAGGVGGYLYYLLIGCASGACAITSNPLISTLYGAVLGLLLGVIAAPGKSEPPDAAH